MVEVMKIMATSFKRSHACTAALSAPTLQQATADKIGRASCRATQYGPVMVESSEKTWSTGEGNGKPLQYSCLESPMISVKRQMIGH